MAFIPGALRYKVGWWSSDSLRLALLWAAVHRYAHHARITDLESSVRLDRDLIHPPKRWTLAHDPDRPVRSFSQGMSESAQAAGKAPQEAAPQVEQSRRAAQALTGMSTLKMATSTRATP